MKERNSTNVCYAIIAILFCFLSLLSFSDSIDTQLTASSTNYDNNRPVELTLRLHNSGVADIDNIAVATHWLDIEGKTDQGSTQKAFKSLIVSASVEGPGTSPGTFLDNTDLAVTDARLPAGATIIYTIKATVNSEVSSPIDLLADINGIDSNTLVLSRTVYDNYTIVKTSKSKEYQPGGKAVFTVRVDNQGADTIYHAQVTDDILGITALDVNNKQIQAFKSVDSITAKTEQKGSDAGSFSAASDNLDASEVSIISGGWVEYEITCTVDSQLVGDIVNKAMLIVRGVNTPSDPVTLQPSKEDISIVYSASPNEKYRVGQEIVYTITVTNKGQGYAHDYAVFSAMTSLKVKLANNNVVGPPYDNTDIQGNPFGTWTIDVTSIGPSSHSGIKSPIKDNDLVDTVSIAPLESINYEIKATTLPVAISPIDTKVSATSHDGKIIVDKALSVSAEALSTDVTIKKTTTSKDYVPGGWVEYVITVTNNDKTQFVDDYKLVDQISSCLKVDLIDDSSGPPFSEWQLSVSTVKGDGSDPGKFDYGASKTGDIELSFDLAPAGTLTYVLKAKVNKEAIGTILDDGSCPGDNVKEEGSGLSMPDGNPEVLKLVDQLEFAPGSPLTYTITVKNKGDGYLNKIPVVDEITKVQANVAGGGVGRAFETWTVSARAEDASGNPSSNSNPDVDHTLGNNKDINTHATVFPGDTIIYTIVGITRNTIISDVVNKVVVDTDGKSEVGSKPYKYHLHVSKSADKYAYSESDNSITYSIVVSNDKYAGFAKDIPVDDDIQKVTAERLHPSGSTMLAFKSWEITTSSEGTNADPGLNRDYKTTGLHALASIPAGGKITYTITAQLEDRTQDKIVWGTISNSVTVKTETGDISDKANVTPKIPSIQIEKTVQEPYYEAGSVVHYGIVIRNIGDGYSNNLQVDDEISKLGLFASWTVDVDKKEGLGTRLINDIPPNQNINTQVDIAPHGMISFVVTGKVIDDISKIDVITNTVKVHDNATGRDFAASADIDKDKNKPSFYITKRTNGIYYTPGDILTYTVAITNKGLDDFTNLTLLDPLSTLSVMLANKKDGLYPDVRGTPFNKWRYKVENQAWSDWMTKNIILKNFEVKSKQERELTIEVDVKDNVVSRRIANSVFLFAEHDGKLQHFAHATIENLRANSGGRVTYDVTPKEYKPGDEVTYTIRASSNVGYFNNIPIEDKLESLEVMTLSGVKKHPFSDKFTVSAKIDPNNNPGGTTDGTLDGVVQDNKNLDVIIDVGPKDAVTYTIKGIVRDDAIGPINNNGTAVEPFKENYQYIKSTDENNYTPGQALNYTLYVVNVGRVHINDLHIVDHYSDIMVNDVDDNPVKAFTDWTITAVEQPIKVNPSTGAKPAFEKLYNAGIYTDNADIDLHADIPIGGVIAYKIKATVNPRAAGKIANVASFNGHTTSVVTGPNPSNYSLTKDIIAFMDKDGNPMSEKLYMPGGYIKYLVKFDNNYGGNIKNAIISDRLSHVMTTWYDGRKGKAFESWTITANTDGGGVSNAGKVTDNADIFTTVDVGSGGFVSYEITAKVNEEAIGTIVNQFSAGAINIKSDPAMMSPGLLRLTKLAFEEDTLAIGKSTYKPMDTVFYRIRLQNFGDGTLINLGVTDLISKLKTDIAEDETTHGQRPRANPFKEWRVSVIYDKGRVTNPGHFNPGQVDIDTRVDIAPRETMDFIIEADIIYPALGNITNRVVAGGRKAGSTIRPEAKNITIDKKILSINKVDYTPGMTYAPGDEVVYQMVISNSASDSWANDVKIVDEISGIETEMNTGLIASAFSTWTTKSAVQPNPDPLATEHTYVPPVSDNSNIAMQIDIAPKEVVTLTTTATVKQTTMGVIPGNQFQVDDKTTMSDEIPPYAAALITGKEVVHTDADDDPLHHYAPNGTVTYRVWVENTGKGYAKGSQLTDPINTILSSDGQSVFEDWSVQMEPPAPSLSYITGDFDGNVVLNATANIAPLEKYSFLIKARVKGNVTGTVTNTFTVDGVDKTVDLEAGEAKLIAEKTASASVYSPGQPITFTLAITNQSDSIAKSAVTDRLSAIQVKTLDGTNQPALTDIKIRYEIQGDKANSDVSVPFVDKDNNLSTMITVAANKTPGGGTADYTRIVFIIDAKVRDDAIGDLILDEGTARSSNSAMVGKALVDLGYYIKPDQPDIKVVKKPSKTSAEYSPDETIGFDIEITNAGKGYTTDTALEDLLANLTTEVAGSHKTEQVITAWKNPTVTFRPNTGLSRAIPGKEENNAKGYFNDFMIHPNETAIVHLEGTVNHFALGDIKNTVNVTEQVTGQAGTSDAVYTPAKPILIPEKSADKDKFFPGDTITYTIKVNNAGTGWASQVKILDDLSIIETDVIGDIKRKAFVEGSLTATHDGDPALVNMTVADNKLEAVADIPPKSTLKFTLVARLRTGIVGTVTNTVVADATRADETIVPLKEDVNFIKVAVNTVYHLDEMTRYTITVLNQTKAAANDVKLADALKDIKVLTADGTKKPAFQSWSISLTPDAANYVLDEITKKEFVTSYDENLSVKLDLAPENNAIFTIDAKVIKDAIGIIENASTLIYNGKAESDDTRIHPDEPHYSATKVSEEAYYQPGQPLHFKLRIKNTSKNYIYQWLLNDPLDDVEVLLSTGSTGPAFIPGSAGFTPIIVPPDSKAEAVPATPYSYLLTIAPGDEVVFNAEGTVVADAIGPINNVAIFHHNKIPSNDVPLVTPKIKAEFYTTNRYYIPGEAVEYHLKLSNIGKTFAYRVPVNTLFSESTGQYITGITGPSFDSWLLSATTDTGGQTNPGTFSDNKDIATDVNIDVNGWIDYTIMATTDIDMTSLIDVYATFNQLLLHAKTLPNSRSATDKHVLSVLNLPPVPSEMVVKKTADKVAYTEDDTQVIYTLTAYNAGKGNLPAVHLFDDLRLKDKEGKQVFSEWTIQMKEKGESKSTDDIKIKGNQDINFYWNFKSQARNIVELIVKATLNPEITQLDEDITNRFTATDGYGKMTEDTVTTHIKKSDMIVSKRAIQTEIHPGEAVEYEIIVENSNTTFSIEDQYPAGFRYVTGSARIFNGKNWQNITPEVSDLLVFKLQKLKSSEKLIIRYVLTAGIGVTFGKYENCAYAIKDGKLISNKATAIVTITGDKLFDTAAIIGKVFEDHNGNGYQSEATAKNIRIQAKVDPGNYIPGTTTLQQGQESRVLSDNAKPVINSGILIKALPGQSGNRVTPANTVRLRFKTRTDTVIPFTVSTQSGTRVVFDSKGEFEKQRLGDVAKGLSNEDLNVTRNLFRQGNDYLWEILIENLGVNDEGIPGVRLITAEGIKVETDEFGRYHIPDRWVMDNKGQNYIIKLDTDSLPAGMRVISENPKVHRLTPSHLAKFNFSVQRETNSVEKKP